MNSYNKQALDIIAKESLNVFSVNFEKSYCFA